MIVLNCCRDASFLYLGLRLMPNENGSSGRVSPVESATNLASSADSSTVVEGNTTLPEGLILLLFLFF